MSYSQRLSTTKTTLKANTALLISDPLDIFYLTGFICLTPEEREAIVFLTPHSAHLFLTAFSAPTQIEGLEVHIGGVERMLKEQLANLSQKDLVSTLLIDGNSLRFNEYELIRATLPAEINIQPTPETPLQRQRMIKDADEIERITQANHITHQALNLTLSRIQVGMSELEVQEIFENQVRRFGTTQFAFPTIVAFGPHSALPHHQPLGNVNTEQSRSARGKLSDNSHILKENTAVLIDCGAKWQGYCADVTRTVWFGDNPDPEFTKIESVVKEAYKNTVAQLHKQQTDVTELTDLTNITNVTAAHLDKTARDFITEQGYGSQFIHTTGHGVGLYIHEQPSLSQRNTTQLQPNMVITVEPGIYLPEKFGYRFENSILLTKSGYQELL